MHIETYGVPPSECVLCEVRDPLYSILLDDGGTVTVHECHLEAEDD